MLGLSITSTSVGWVLLDGEGPDAATLDHDAFDVASGPEVGEKPQHTAAARGAQAIATASGHRVGSLRVTWSQAVEADATALMKSLADLGNENVHAISLSEATRSWAIEAGRANDHAKTALCILEPGTATVMVVATGAGSVRTAVTNTREHTLDLVDWLTTIFNRDGWLPECLHLVGSHDDLDAVKGPIGDRLPIPVIASVDSQLALARGAALATVWPVAVISSPVAEAARPDTPRPDRAKLLTDRAKVLTDRSKLLTDRPKLLMDARKVAVSAAAFAVVGGVLSLAAGSALNVGQVSMEAANSPAADTSATSSVRPVAAPIPPPAAAPVQAMVAPPPPAAQPAPPETVAVPDEPVAAVRPERADAPVYQQTVPASPLANVSAAAPTAAAVPAAPTAAPLASPARSAAPPAAPLAVPPAVPPGASLAVPPGASLAVPPAAPLAVPPAAPLGVPPAAPLGVPPAAPLAAPIATSPVPAEPPDAPPPPDPLQIVMSPLLGGLP